MTGNVTAARSSEWAEQFSNASCFYRPIIGLRCADENEDDCSTTITGPLYSGHISVTLTGIECQAWASQTPNDHTYTDDSMYPADGGVVSASNYCRSPDGGSDYWCYMADDTSWDYCFVPACGQSLHFIK